MKSFIIDKNYSIKDTLKAMDKVSNKVLFIVENDVLLGSVSDGDIRRSLLNGNDLSLSVEKIMNINPITANTNLSNEQLKKLMLKHEIQTIPITDKQNKIIDIVLWHKLFTKLDKVYKKTNVPAIIMAGGRGTRLEPFTKILPKPLIPVGNKTIIELIMDEYQKFGIHKFYFTVNYKSKLIKAYFEENDQDYDISYIDEIEPLGTAGSLQYIKDKIKTDFFVSNCDIIIKEDYTKIFAFHQKGKYDLTLVASVQHHTVPYGVCEIGNGGDLVNIIEKPEYDFFVNTGMYILNPTVLDFIPKNKFYHITHLIADLKKAGKKVGVFPVSEKSWIDIGQWNEYKKTMDALDNLLRN